MSTLQQYEALVAQAMPYAAVEIEQMKARGDYLSNEALWLRESAAALASIAMTRRETVEQVAERHGLLVREERRVAA